MLKAIVIAGLFGSGLVYWLDSFGKAVGAW